MSHYPTTPAHARLDALRAMRMHGEHTNAAWAGVFPAEAAELALLEDIVERLDQHRASTQSLHATAERLRREHRATLDAVNAELLAVRTQGEELAVLYGKARLDADKAQAGREEDRESIATLRKERDDARAALNEAQHRLSNQADTIATYRRQRDEASAEREGFKDAWGRSNDEIEALKESLETLKDAATLRDAVRSLVDTENARRRFSNERRAETGLKRPPLRLIPRP